jgi:hypothetical protein
MGAMYPISRLRLGSHVAVFRLKELPSGFRVISGEAVLIDSLSSEAVRIIRDNILSLEANQPGKICCMAMYNVEEIGYSNTSFFEGYSFGDYSDLASLQDDASFAKVHQVKLIMMLNKEV